MGTRSSDREARRAMLLSVTSQGSENKDPSIEWHEKGGSCLRQLLVQEVADSAGDVGSLSFCYTIIKSMLVGGSFDDSSASRLNSADAFVCCLALHDQCRTLSSVQGGSVAVGSLLAAGIALSSFVSIQCDKERINEYIGRFLQCVQSEFQRTDCCAAWEQYGGMLCKTLNKMALALLKDGNSDVCFQVCTKGILCVVKHVPDVILKTLKSLVALSQHLRDKSQQMGLVVESMEIWMGIETCSDDSIADQCLSCARRALPEVESWTWCDDGMAVQTMLGCVQLVYSRHNDKDPHAGLAAIGAVAKYLSSEKGRCTWREAGVHESLNEALDAVLGSRNAVKEGRFRQTEQLKELRWLSSVLHKCAGEDRAQGGESVSVALSSASLRCHIKLLVCEESCESRHRISGEIIERAALYWKLAGREDELIRVVHHLWLHEMSAQTSKLLALLIRNGIESSSTNNFSPASFIWSILNVSKKNKWGTDIVQSIAKDSVVCLGMVGEMCPEYLESLQPEAENLISTIRKIFNPAKNADAYLDIMLSCHMYSHVFSTVFTIDQFALDAKEIRDRTKTKIGYKRISDILDVIEALKVERMILDMMKKSLKTHEEEAAHKKRMLQNDPSLVHSDEWRNKQSHQVTLLISDKGMWDELVRKAKTAIDTCQCISTLQSSHVVLAQLEQFVTAHDLEGSAPNAFWESLMEFSAFEVKDLSDCLEDLEIAMKMPEQDSLTLSHLNMSLSRYQATQGHLQSAIFHAMESYKHVTTMVNAFPPESTGSWCSIIMHCVACTSWLGFLFAGSGLFEESIQSYTEGLKMARFCFLAICLHNILTCSHEFCLQSCMLGSPLVTLYFSVNLAEVFLNSGDFSRFQSKVCESVELMSCASTGHDSGPTACVSAHLHALRAHIDRKNLEFGLAKQKLDSCEKSLDALSQYTWYRSRVMATCAYQRILAILDEDSSMVPEDIDSSIRKIEVRHKLLQGVSYHQMYVVKAQLLSQKFMKASESSRATIWVSQPIREDGTVETLESLGSIASRLKYVPFCQKIVFKLMAPMFALCGCKFTAISLLHSATNPTLNFQFDLVGHTKSTSKDLKSGNVTLLNESRISGIMGEFGSMFDASCKFDLDAMESKARDLVTSWTESLPNVVICGVSVYDRHVYGCSDSFRDTIVLHRVKKNQVPIIVQIPSPELESSHPIHRLHGMRSCGVVQLMREKLEDILKRSNANMRSISPDCSEAEQRSWWMQRVELDDAMQGILSNLHADWIGPWRCLFGDVENVDTRSEFPSDEYSLLSSLVSKERAMLSESEMETLSAAVEISFYDVDGSMISKMFGELNLDEKQNFSRRSLGKTVSFKLDTKDETDLMPSSPEIASVMRSEPDNGVMERLSSMNIADDSERSIPSTPARGLDPSHPPGVSGAKSVMRKHKSRLVQMHALGTPGPRKILGSRNNASENFETPRTCAKAAPKVGSLLDTAKTMPPVRKSRPRQDEESSTTPGTPVVLTLDQSVQSLPWESSFRLLTGKTTKEFYRIPSLPSFAATCGRKNKIQTNSCFYTLNPSGDLISTQTVFESWFKGMEGWSGKAGCPPQVSELAHALQNKDLFIYCGHGGGEQYIPLSRLRSLDSCALSLLMGCSSGKLKWSTESQYDATGVVLAYTLAGCPAVVGNLWDVTDKDIDRYCQEMLTKMLSFKTMSIGQLVQFSRQACKLPYLIGAAPICYGIPVQFD